MRRILLTGGTVTLGRSLAPRLSARGATVRVMSRREPREGEARGVEWARADLLGKGLGAALADVDAVVHAATDPVGRPAEIDVEGTARLLDAASAAGVRHLVYVSIVGIDRIPLPYYRHKLAAEGLVERSTVPHTIVRITQFHDLIDMLLRRRTRLPALALLPAGAKFQPIHVGDAAAAVVRCAEVGPVGRAPDVGGPEILELVGLARAWLHATHRRRLVLGFPMPGGFAAALKAGHACAPDGRRDGVTWRAWLGERYGRSGRVA